VNAFRLILLQDLFWLIYLLMDAYVSPYNSTLLPCYAHASASRIPIPRTFLLDAYAGSHSQRQRMANPLGLLLSHGSASCINFGTQRVHPLVRLILMAVLLGTLTSAFSWFLLLAARTRSETVQSLHQSPDYKLSQSWAQYSPWFPVAKYINAPEGCSIDQVRRL
jgi:hypothetical protein